MVFKNNKYINPIITQHNPEVDIISPSDRETYPPKDTNLPESTQSVNSRSQDSDSGTNVKSFI